MTEDDEKAFNNGASWSDVLASDEAGFSRVSLLYTFGLDRLAF